MGYRTDLLHLVSVQKFKCFFTCSIHSLTVVVEINQINDAVPQWGAAAVYLPHIIWYHLPKTQLSHQGPPITDKIISLAETVRSNQHVGGTHTTGFTTKIPCGVQFFFGLLLLVPRTCR